MLFSEVTESGDEENEATELLDEHGWSRGKRTAIVPPPAVRVVSPHMMVLKVEK